MDSRRTAALLVLCLALTLALRAAGPDAHPPACPVAGGAAAPVPPDPLELYARLGLADPAAPEDRAWLEELAGGLDGLAYHACVLLARSGAEATYFQRALDLRYTPAIQLEYARALESEGRSEEALMAWLRILAPGEALEALRRLEPDPVKRAGHLNQRRLATQALAELGGEQGATAARERALALARLGRHVEALPHFRAWLAGSPEDAAVLLAHAASLEAAGRLTDAAREYRASGPAGGLGLGRMLERSGRPAEAAEAYLSSSDVNAHWQAALILERRGRAAEALIIYGDLASGSSRLAGDAAFRGVVVARRLGQPEGPFRALIAPTSHWAWRLGWREDPAPPPPVEPVEPAALTLASQLAAGAPGPGTPLELAHLELEIALPRLEDPEALAVGNWYLERGDYRRAARIGMALLPRLPTRDVYLLAYPLAYRDLVVDAGVAFGVEPYLLWAVMREESHYSPSALSVAGARGLMQVMPATGSWLAGRMGIAYVGPEDLYQPAVSVRMGAWYLGYLLSRFEGSLDLTLAAYNGGEGSVLGWLESPLYRDPHDFPAVITFTETREYLTKVLDTLLVYRWLYPELTGPAS